MKEMIRINSLKLVLGVCLVLISACAPKTQISVLSPAEINTQAIKTVAIGSFEIGYIHEKFISERNGGWIRHPVQISDEQKKVIGRAVRSRVVNLLTATPFFKVVFTDEFAALENDAALQQLVSTQGYQTQNVDAVINGKLWIDIDRTDGAELNKIALEYAYGTDKSRMDLSIDQVVWWPYKSIRGAMGLEMKLTRLNPMEVIAVTFDARHYSHKIGGIPPDMLATVTDAVGSLASSSAESDQEDNNKQKIENSNEVFPSFNQMIADLALSIAANFVQKIAVTEKKVSYPIAPGDEGAKVLILAGAYGMAIEKLQQITGNNPQSHADLYNLGLCFEAQGDYGLALNFYRDAFRVDRLVLYAQGIGRIERLQREYPTLRKQIQEKQK